MALTCVKSRILRRRKPFRRPAPTENRAGRIFSSARQTVLKTTMDKAMALAHLALAERHIARGYEHLASQTRIVANLENAGHDTAMAQSLLETFRDIQRIHLADRDRIKRELAAFPGHS